MQNTNNTRRLIDIFEQSMKEHTYEIVYDLLYQNLLDPADYISNASVLWFELQDDIFDRYTGRTIFPTADLIIRSLNFIRETEIVNYGNVLSYQDIANVYNVDNIFRKTAQYLVEYEINDMFKEWVKDCLIVNEINEINDETDDDETIEIIPDN